MNYQKPPPVLESIKAQISRLNAWETRHWLTVESVSSDKSSDGCGDSSWGTQN